MNQENSAFHTDINYLVYLNSVIFTTGSVQGAALTEYVMEHISHTLNKDPLEVRVANFMKKGDPFFIGEVFNPAKLVPLEVENLMPPMIHELKETGDYENRKQFVEKFNKV
jgi:xanthine dehydrogenase molybdopterin-binding subunit B